MVEYKSMAIDMSVKRNAMELVICQIFSHQSTSAPQENGTFGKFANNDAKISKFGCTGLEVAGCILH